MANICEYKGIIKGKKNACYAVFGSMSCMDDKQIVEEGEKDGEYYLRFEGDCKWSVDSYCTERENTDPLDIPEDIEEAEAFGEDNWYIPQYQKPNLFGVELWINSADVEDYDPEWYDECGGHYEHYAKNGEEINDDCPKELYIKNPYGDMDDFDEESDI